LEKRFFNNGAGYNGDRIPTCKTWKLDSYFLPCMKINSKQVKDLNVKHESLKL
jgi:hypothetical protein